MVNMHNAPLIFALTCLINKGFWVSCANENLSIINPMHISGTFININKWTNTIHQLGKTLMSLCFKGIPVHWTQANRFADTKYRTKNRENFPLLVLPVHVPFHRTPPVVSTKSPPIYLRLTSSLPSITWILRDLSFILRSTRVPTQLSVSQLLSSKFTLITIPFQSSPTDFLSLLIFTLHTFLTGSPFNFPSLVWILICPLLWLKG